MSLGQFMLERVFAMYEEVGREFELVGEVEVTWRRSSSTHAQYSESTTPGVTNIESAIRQTTRFLANASPCSSVLAVPRLALDHIEHGVRAPTRSGAGRSRNIA